MQALKMFLFTAFWHYIAYPWHYRQCSLCGITVQPKALHAIVMLSIALCIVCVLVHKDGQIEAKTKQKKETKGYHVVFLLSSNIFEHFVIFSLNISYPCK